MSDEKKKGDIYFVQVKGAPPRLVRSTDPRLARKHVLAGIFPPEVEVRRPTTEEAMDMALDGVAVEDGMAATGASEPAPEPEPDLLDTKPSDERPNLNDPPRINPNDGPVEDDE